MPTREDLLVWLLSPFLLVAGVLLVVPIFAIALPLAVVRHVLLWSSSTRSSRS